MSNPIEPTKKTFTIAQLFVFLAFVGICLGWWATKQQLDQERLSAKRVVDLKLKALAQVSDLVDIDLTDQQLSDHPLIQCLGEKFRFDPKNFNTDAEGFDIPMEKFDLEKSVEVYTLDFSHGKSDEGYYRIIEVLVQDGTILHCIDSSYVLDI